MKGLSRYFFSAKKRLIRDLLFFAVLWVCLFIVLGSHSSGILQFRAVTRFFDDTGGTVQEAAGALRQTLTRQGESAEQVAPIEENAQLIHDQDPERAMAVVSENEPSSAPNNEQNNDETEALAEDAQETFYFRYENGNYVAYPEGTPVDNE